MPGYFGLVRKTEGTSYRVAFPDFPDCGADGRTPEEAWLRAQKALLGHVAHLRRDGGGLPSPTQLSSLVAQRSPDLHDILLVRV